MKLLDRIHQRGGPSRKDTNEIYSSPPRNMKTSKRYQKNDISPTEKRRIHQQIIRNQDDDKPINLALRQNKPNLYHHHSGGKKSFSNFSDTFSNNEDESTLYFNDNRSDWSVADNAPSNGSAGELFNDDNINKKGSFKRRFFRSGYASSSDEEDDSNDHSEDGDDDNDGPHSANFQYSKLSDSPPPKSISSSGKKHNTPSRSGEKKQNRVPSNKQKESPKGIRMLSWKKKPSVKVIDETAEPVDVDRFIGIVSPCATTEILKQKYGTTEKENVIPLSKKNTSKSSSQEVEIQIMSHRGTETINNSLSLGALRLDNGDAFYGPSVSSYEYINDTGLQTQRVSKKNQMIHKDVDKWLLSDEKVGELQLAIRKKHQYELQKIQNELQNDETRLSDKNVKVKKSIKSQMKDKIQSLVSTKQKYPDSNKMDRRKFLKSNLSSDFSMQPLTGMENDFGNQETKTRDRSKITKPNLSRKLSEFSMQPLTGIEDGFVKQDTKTRQEICMEIEHRKNVEKQAIQKHEAERQFRSGEYDQRRHKQSMMRKYDQPVQRLDSNQISIKSDAALDLERHNNPERLQQWVMGFSHIRRDKPLSHTTASHGRKAVDSTKYKSDESVFTLKTDNKSRLNNSDGLSSRRKKAFEKNVYSDEDSAQTPFTSAPSQSGNSFNCVVCKQAERTHLASPCMHFSFCGDCVNRLLAKKKSGNMRCVVCKDPVSKFSKVFF